MKSFKNKKALTLVELVTSITIWSIILIVIIFFITSSIKELNIWNIKSASIDESFTFRDKINRFIKWWMNDFSLYWTGVNNTIVIQDDDLTSWIIIGVINNNTKKIQKEYIYWDNFLWYKKLSELELNNIESNSWVIYDFIFKDDKIFRNMVIKDFNAELYNLWDILDLNISIVNLLDNSHYWKNIVNVYFDPLDIYEFNLVF